MRALVASLVLLGCASGSAASNKETVIQAGMAGGVVACGALLEDQTIVAEPEARAWCMRMVNGCRDLPKRAESTDEQPSQFPR